MSGSRFLTIFEVAGSGGDGTQMPRKRTPCLRKRPGGVRGNQRHPRLAACRT